MVMFDGVLPNYLPLPDLCPADSSSTGAGWHYRPYSALPQKRFRRRMQSCSKGVRAQFGRRAGNSGAGGPPAKAGLYSGG